jgi:hypothetical protein
MALGMATAAVVTFAASVLLVESAVAKMGMKTLDSGFDSSWKGKMD